MQLPYCCFACKMSKNYFFFFSITNVAAFFLINSVHSDELSFVQKTKVKKDSSLCKFGKKLSLSTSCVIYTGVRDV